MDIITTKRAADIWLQSLSEHSEEIPEEDLSLDLGLMAMERPEDCWEVMLFIFRQTTDERTLANLAAGPIEDLLVFHGEKVINWVGLEAQRDPKFRAILSGVWRNAMHAETWDKLQSFANS